MLKRLINLISLLDYLYGSVELNTMAVFEVCKKYNFDKVEVLRMVKSSFLNSVGFIAP